MCTAVHTIITKTIPVCALSCLNDGGSVQGGLCVACSALIFQLAMVLL